MNIKYNYNVIIVDESAKVMEVVYTSVGLRDHHISMPLPEQGVPLEVVVQQYAPMYQWGLESAQYEPVSLNASGTIDMPAIEAQKEADRIAHFNSAEGRKERTAARRYDEEVKGITLSNMEISTDRTSQALLTGAVTAAQLDPNLTAKWKLKNGNVTLDKTQLDTIAMAVRNHVQACFDREIEIIEAIDAGTFTDAMLDTGWPA